MPSHPGGSLIQRAAGLDASDLFHAHHASPAAAAVLEKIVVGFLKPSRPKAGAKTQTVAFFQVATILPGTSLAS